MRALLSSYVDGQVTEGERRRVEQHLATCDGCKLELRDLQTTVSLLRELPQLDLPRSYTLSSVPEPLASPATVLWGVWVTRAASAAAAVFLVALIVGDALGVVTQQTSSVMDSLAVSEAMVEVAEEVEAEVVVEKEVIKQVINEVVKEGPVEMEVVAEAETLVEKEVVSEVSVERTVESEAIVPKQPVATAALADSAIAEKSVAAPDEPILAPTPVAEPALPSTEIAAAPVASLDQPSTEIAAVAPPEGDGRVVREDSTPGEASLAAGRPLAEMEAEAPAADVARPAPAPQVAIGRESQADGIGLPLWQLEAGVAVGLVLMAGAAFWTGRRRGRLFH